MAKTSVALPLEAASIHTKLDVLPLGRLVLGIEGADRLAVVGLLGDKRSVSSKIRKNFPF